MKAYRPELLKNYTPVFKPMPPLPIEAVCDSPLVCVAFSDAYVPYLLGLLEIYRWKESFNGTEEENVKSVGLMADLMGEIAMACCCDGTSALTVVVQTRVNLDGSVSISIDNGITWTPSPDSLGYHILQYPPPVTAGVSANKCDAATNGHQHCLDKIAEVSAGFDSTGTLLDFLKLVADIVLDLFLIFVATPEGIPFVDTLIELLFGTVKSVYEARKTAWDEYWQTIETDKILCALYCNISEDGTFTDSGYAGAIAQLQSDLTAGVQKDLFMQIIKAGGKAGLDKICSYGNAAAGDCASCTCFCDLTLWDIRLGTLVSRDETHITLQSQFVDGTWVAEIRANVESAGCSLALPTYEGPDTATIQFDAKGEAFVADFPGALGHGGIWGARQCVNAVLVFGDGGGEIGQVTFTLDGDCP